jgi:hypothetical protein
MVDMNNKVQQKINQRLNEQLPEERQLFPCSIYAISRRFKLLYLQSLTTGHILQSPSMIPHQDVYRIPTPDRNYVMLQTMGGPQIQGVPILMDRNWIEPWIFETIFPNGESS